MDPIFPSDNPLDVPVLDPAWQPIGLEGPLVAWGTRRRGRTMPGTWHCYVDDYRFTALWDRPELVVESGAVAIVEPNYTLLDDTPAAVAIGLTYRKRWLARYWQSCGVRVWVDLNVSAAFAEVNMLGVPATWRAFATRGYEERPEALLAEHALVADRPGLVMLVYGGGPRVRWEAERLGCVHVADQASVSRDRVREVLRRGVRVR